MGRFGSHSGSVSSSVKQDHLLTTLPLLRGAQSAAAQGPVVGGGSEQEVRPPPWQEDTVRSPDCGRSIGNGSSVSLLAKVWAAEF